MNTRRHAKCPTCMRNGEFNFLGVQEWPPAVAEKLGLPTKIILWSCPHCQTTVSDPDLLPATHDPEDEEDFLFPNRTMTPRRVEPA